MTEQISLLDDQLVDMRFITKLTGLTDKWFYTLIKDGVFPKPIKPGRSSRRRQSEVETWLQVRIDASRRENSAPATTRRLTTIAVEVEP
ncbi:AlpA family transcriptional regulator [Salmonella enterica]|nr:AlpA family transcriptional regulator [Salmonella enterica]EJF5828755.1 AlpA family transcriptional regulator [Salmonella enterica]EJF5854531.1 AlpA family transcriptional regulator [Salmonella enterica]EJF5946609.1 AlpA family transcriptional regulator [Salmonella enterica]EJF6156220.1 AlpA family transcriptional regulator [Salmonella enterica]